LEARFSPPVLKQP